MKKKIWLIAALAVWALILLVIVLVMKPAGIDPTPTDPDILPVTDPLETDPIIIEGTLPNGEQTVPPTDGSPTDAPTDSPTEVTTEPTQGQANQQAPPVTPPAPTNPPAPTEPEVVLIPPDLTYSKFGRYTGVYVEDGSDELVENVAIILVTNPTNEFLEYAQTEFEVGGKSAVFVVRGLPPGASAWVMEANRLTIPAGSVFNLVDEVTSFGSSSNTDDLKLILGTGAISAENTSDKTMNNVYVYYRQTHTDGNYLGGICYRVSFGTLEPGSPMTATAGHCTPERAAIVKVTFDKE